LPNKATVLANIRNWRGKYFLTQGYYLACQSGMIEALKGIKRESWGTLLRSKKERRIDQADRRENDVFFYFGHRCDRALLSLQKKRRA
jgi:hypothetical protein